MTRIDQRFDIVSLVGEGGMGRVFRAVDQRDQSTVALKVMHEGNVGADTLVRFAREVEALAKLEHPTIVRYVSHGTTDVGAAYLAMQWVEGEDLRARLKRGALSVIDTLTVTSRIAAALAHTHERGLIHRDVKPANVVLRDSKLEAAMLIDFGLARAGGDEELTRANELVGTPSYMAPEQVRNNNVTTAVDVFALGCVIYQCLTGASPFHAHGATAVLARVLFDEPTPLANLVSIPNALADLVDTMLRKTPEARPTMRHALEVLVDLRASLSDHSLAPRHVEALSTGEQHIVSVVIAGEPSATRTHEEKEDELRRAEQANIDSSRLAAIAARFDAEVTFLPNGALIGVLRTRGVATDLAARAAECALALQLHLHGAPIALATGRAEAAGGVHLGEAIDRAAALAQLAHIDAVRIDDVTAGLLGDRFECEAHESGVLLRGRRHLDRARTLLGIPTPCVGRDAELAMLEGIVAQCAGESVARAVLVTAPTGIGKSRLRYELVRRVLARGDAAQIWMARPDSFGAGAPFGMIAQMIRHTSGVLEGEPAETIREKLVARVAESVPDGARRRVTNFLGEMIGARFPDDRDVELRAARHDPMLMSDQLVRAFVDFVDAESEERPLIFVLEDLQWGDLPTVSALDTVLRLMADRPILVAAFARPEVSEVFPSLWAERDLQSLPLTPLPRKAGERLVLAALGARGAEVAQRLVTQANGNAFYLEELIRAVAENRSSDAPPTVVAMVQGRLEALEPEARRLLRAASVFGETCWAGGVRALLGADATETRRWFDELGRRELLGRRAKSRVANEAEYVFRHALVREGAYAMLTEHDRVLGHRLAAEWLEHVGETAAIVVAEHYAKGGEKTRAATLYLRAAEQALEGNDLVAAIEHAERGVASGASGELLGALRTVQTQAHFWHGETVKMDQAATEALSLLPRGTAAWADAIALLGVAKQRLGHVRALDAVARDLLRALDSPDGDAGALGKAGGRLASILYFADQHALAGTLLTAAENAARGRGAEIEARIHQARAPRARQAGRPSEALEHAEAAARSFQLAGDERNVCLMTGIRGFALAELGAYTLAEPVLHEALAMAERLGLRLVAATARSNLGIVLLRLGRGAEAQTMERAALAAFNAQDRRQEGGSRCYMAMILADSGALDEAESEARTALALLATAPALRPLAAGVLSNVLLARGRATEALDVTREAMQWLDAGRNVEEGESLVRLAHTRALVATGDRANAMTVLMRAKERILERAETIDIPELRATFLANVPEHVMTLSLARESLPR